MTRASERDLVRAELIAFPLLLLLTLWVFRGLVAALVPLAAGALTIATTLALLRVVNLATPVSVFALNLVTGAGLGLAIDYSLLLVSRYREELARQRAVARGGTRDDRDRRAHGRVQLRHRRGGVRLAARRSRSASCARWRSAALIVAPLAGVVALARRPGALRAARPPHRRALARALPPRRRSRGAAGARGRLVPLRARP